MADGHKTLHTFRAQTEILLGAVKLEEIFQRTIDGGCESGGFARLGI